MPRDATRTGGAHTTSAHTTKDLLQSRPPDGRGYFPSPSYDRHELPRVGRRSWVSTRSVSSPRGSSSTVTRVLTLFVSGPIHGEHKLPRPVDLHIGAGYFAVQLGDDMTRLNCSARAQVAARRAIDCTRIGAHPPHHQIRFGPQVEDLVRRGAHTPAYHDRARHLNANHACDPLAPACGPS